MAHARPRLPILPRAHPSAGHHCQQQQTAEPLRAHDRCLGDNKLAEALSSQNKNQPVPPWRRRRCGIPRGGAEYHSWPREPLTGAQRLTARPFSHKRALDTPAVALLRPNNPTAGACRRWGGYAGLAAALALQGQSEVLHEIVIHNETKDKRGCEDEIIADVSLWYCHG